MVIHQENRTIGIGSRQLETDTTSANSEDNPNSSWKIEEVIELWVESDYYLNGDEEIRIYNFTLESINSQ